MTLMLSNSRLTNTTFHSRALRRSMQLHLYLPPDYAEDDTLYPVVYLLHPWGQEGSWWTAVLRLHEVADRLIAAGAIPPFVGVMPQGDKSFFINAADPGGDFTPILRIDPQFFEGALEGYGDYADYLLGEAIPFVERKYAVRFDPAGRVIAGISMGGAGAAVLAFTHPEMFGAVGIHSPALFTSQRLGPPWIFGLGDPQALAERDPVHLAKRLVWNSRLRIYLDCGLDDEMMEPVADLHYALVERGISHTYLCRPGSHDLSYWSAHLAEYLGFYTAGW